MHIWTAYRRKGACAHLYHQTHRPPLRPEGITTAKGDKGGKYKNKCRKKNDPKRDREHDSNGNRYKRKIHWKKTDEAQIRKGRSNAPRDLKEIADSELEAMNAGRGRGRRYEIAPIVLMVIWQYYCSVSSHTLRSVQGWSEETIAERFGVRVPHYSTFSKRSKQIGAILSPAADSLKGKPLIAAADSTGIGSRWAGLWRHFIWGSARGWLKLHALVDVETGIVIAYTVTDGKTGDSSQLLELVDAAVKGGFVLKKVFADGAYDTFECWNGMDERKIPFAANIRENAKVSNRCPSRNKHVRYIKIRGKQNWYEVTGYTMRWKVETAFSSLKKLFGESMRGKNEISMNKELDWIINEFNSYKVMCHGCGA